MKRHISAQRFFAAVVITGVVLLLGQAGVFAATTKGATVAQAQQATQQKIQQFEQLAGQLTGADKQAIEQALADSRKMNEMLQNANAAPPAKRKAEVGKVLKEIAVMSNKQMATLNGMLPNVPEASKAAVQGALAASKNEMEVASAAYAAMKPSKAPRKATASSAAKGQPSVKVTSKAQGANVPAAKAAAPAAQATTPAAQDKK